MRSDPARRTGAPRDDAVPPGVPDDAGPRAAPPDAPRDVSHEAPHDASHDGSRDAPSEPPHDVRSAALRPSVPSPPRATTGDGALREPIVAFSLADSGAAAAPPAPPEPPAVLPVVDVVALDWSAVRAAADPAAVRARAPEIVARAEALLDAVERGEAPGLLFDDARADAGDRAVHVRALDPDTPLWFVGDLHGDLLALEAALALVAAEQEDPARAPCVVFLGDLFDDGGWGLEVLLRVLERLAASPATTCVLAGNHDEALAFDGARFTARVSPSDFADRLNAATDDPWAARAGALAVRLFARAPRALFLPDGLLVAHGGFPLVDLHAELEAHGDWNEARVLSDFVWTRAHPKARRKLPNRASRGSQFGHEDFADFCALAARLGRPVTHLVRGHDHVDDRWAAYPAYAAHPVLTTVALSRRLEREAFGPYVRVPTVARRVAGAVPRVHRLHVPEPDVRALYPEPSGDDAADAGAPR